MAKIGTDVVSCIITQEHGRLWLCYEYFGPSSEWTLRRGRASSYGMKSSSLSYACASQHTPDHQALRWRQRSVRGRLFNTAPKRSLTEQAESWLSPTNPVVNSSQASVATVIQSSFQTYKCTYVTKCVRELWITPYGCIRKPWNF